MAHKKGTTASTLQCIISSNLCLYGALVLYAVYIPHDTFKGFLTQVDTISVNTTLLTNYTPTCTLTPTTLYETVTDFFFWGHFFFWLLKMLVIRDARICVLASIQWEFVEITFQHMLPNFKECWWDRWVVDVVLCNGLGILVASYLIKYAKLQSYVWLPTRSSHLDAVWHVVRIQLVCLLLNWDGLMMFYGKHATGVSVYNVCIVWRFFLGIGYEMYICKWLVSHDSMQDVKLACYQPIYVLSAFFGLIIGHIEVYLVARGTQGAFKDAMDPLVQSRGTLGLSIYMSVVAVWGVSAFCSSTHRRHTKSSITLKDTQTQQVQKVVS